MSATEEDPWR